ncbi:Ankyrin repeat domain-containing protein 27 [Madurella mycetomatis]|uniref:Ankyrin repeat domain-containing protein 27 n=1 Tax=Madurella mycetomatis TaxID=100816 RepID=A0A175VWT3_9PEZI|nr:Ankyrin repeat domain-containing protein 27 [Madurella mycetomatis]
MHITAQELHHISVLAGQGEIIKLRAAVKNLAERENTSTAEVLLACKDDFHQTAAHIAAKSGQTRSIQTLAELLDAEENKETYFNIANRFSGDRPVHTAMRHGFLDVFKALVTNGADPTVKNRFGDTVVDYPGDFEPEEVEQVLDEYRDRMSARIS